MTVPIYNEALRRFQPFAALVRRELLTTLRLRRTWYAMATLVFILAVFAEDQFPGGQYNLNAMARQSRDFFLFMVMGLYVSCLVFVPGIAATAVTIERERQTYDLVRTSLLTPLSFITGKLFNALGIYLLFIVAALPLLGFVFFMVGVDVYAMTAATLITFSTAFALAAAGLLCSVVTRSTVRAVTASYVCMIFLMGLHVGIGAMLVAIVVRDESVLRALTFLIVFVPWMVLGGAMAGETGLAMAAWSAAYLVLTGAALLLIASWRFLRDVKRDETPMGAAPSRSRWRRGKTSSARRPRPSRPVPEGVNPVFWGELLSARMNSLPAFLKRTFLFWLLFFCPAILFVAFLIVAGGSGAGNIMVAIGWFICVAIAVALIVTAASANLITRDADRGNLDFLRTTLVSDGQVLRGKAMMGVAHFAPILLAALAASVPFWFGTDAWEQKATIMAGGYMMLVMTPVVSLCGGLAASAWARRTTTGLALAFGINAMIFLGFSTGAGIVINLLLRQFQEPEMALLIMIPSPILSFAPGGFIAESEFGGYNTDPVVRLVYGLAAAVAQGLGGLGLLSAAYLGIVRKKQE